MSQNFDLGLSFDFMSKNFLYIFKIFSKSYFLHFIKLKLGPKSKFWETLPCHFSEFLMHFYMIYINR